MALLSVVFTVLMIASEFGSLNVMTRLSLPDNFSETADREQEKRIRVQTRRGKIDFIAVR